MHDVVKRIWRSIWLFPAVLLLPLLVLTGLGISGTSEATYGRVLEGSGYRDNNLLVGTYQGVRSDEWLVNTQMTIAQQRAGWPAINHSLGNGQDMSLVYDVPYKDWSTLFKPQNWAFFVLGLEQAFAFKWWLLLYSLIVAGYFVGLRLTGGRRTVAIPAALALGINPFVFWWYQNGTLMPITYSLLMILCVWAVFDRPNRWRQLLLGGLFAYLLAAFALILYPPFQIACALVVGALVMGLFLEYRQRSSPLGLKQLWVLGAGAIAAVGVVYLFFLTHTGAVTALSNTSYPGHRSVMSGGYDLWHFSSSFLTSQLQNWDLARNYQYNQSEASNFILLVPWLIIPAVVMIYTSYRRNRRIDWPLTLVTLVIALFIARMFVPWPNSIYKLLLLDKVPHQRLLIGLGLAGFLQVLLLGRHLQSFRLRQNLTWTGLATGVLALSCMLVVGRHLHHQFSAFLPQPSLIVALAVATAIVVTCVATRRTYVLGVYGWLALSLFASLGIMPLYRGLDLPTIKPLIAKMTAVQAAQPGVWWAVNDRTLVNTPLLAGVPSITGVYSYPQLPLWRRFDPSGQQSTVYNRFAHVIANDAAGPTFELGAQDYFRVRPDPCLPVVGTSYFLGSAPVNLPCTTLVTTVPHRGGNFYIYRSNQP